MSLTTRSRPKRNTTSLCYCAYCHYWEGDSQLRSKGGSMVEFDSSAKGYCVCNGKHASRNAGYSACRDFQLSNEASKYAN